MMTIHQRNDAIGPTARPRREILVIDGGRLVGEPPAPDELPRRKAAADPAPVVLDRDDVAAARDLRSRRVDRRTWR